MLCVLYAGRDQARLAQLETMPSVRVHTVVDINLLLTLQRQIEELVDGLRDLMGAIMVGNDSKYDYAAATIAMREFTSHNHRLSCGA